MANSETTDNGPLDKEPWVIARPEIQSALRRGLIFGLLAGIPLGWATLPFVLGAMGATMEFYW